MGAQLNMSAESHYACYQNEEGQYQTFLFSKDGSSVPLSKTDADQEKKIVAASFMVFSGALKTSSGMTAKLSIVEDGVLIQIMPNVIPELKKALRDMKDYDIHVGKVGEEASECVSLKWGADDTNFNVGVISPIDGRSLRGVSATQCVSFLVNNQLMLRRSRVSGSIIVPILL
jgi:MAD (mothers against decapentaplegic) interacting protein